MIENTVRNLSLNDVIDSMDNVARVAALRGVAHSAMAKCIGSIRQHMRDEARNIRNEDEPQTDLDQRNTQDEDVRGGNDVKYAMGFTVDTPPLAQASLLHAVYSWAVADIKTLATSQWDHAMGIKQMLEFMTKNSPKLDRALAEALAAAVKTDVRNIEKMHELQAMRDREQLIEAAPEIIFTFEGYGENGYNDAIDDLPKVLQHQLGVKVVESLYKARDNVLGRVLRSRRLADLASITLLEDAAKQVKAWVDSMEARYRDEIREALEAGRNVRTLEDIVHI